MCTLMVHTISPHFDCTYHNYILIAHTDCTSNDSTYWQHIPQLCTLTVHTMTSHTDCSYHYSTYWLHTTNTHQYWLCIPQNNRHTDNAYHKYTYFTAPHTGCTYHNSALMLTAHSMTPHTVHEAWHSQNQIHFGVSHPDCQHVMETGDNLSTIMSDMIIWQQVSWFSPVDPKVFFFLSFFLFFFFNGGGGGGVINKFQYFECTRVSDLSLKSCAPNGSYTCTTARW